MMPLWYEEHWQALLLAQALLGVLAFGYALKRRPRFWARMGLALGAGMVLTHLLAGLLFGLGLWGQFATIALLYLILIGVVWACCQESLWTVLFVVSSGYVTQDIASRLKSILRFSLATPFFHDLSSSTAGVLLLDLLCYGGVYLLAYLCFRPFTRRGAESFGSRTKVIFSVVVLLLCAGVTRITRDGTPRSDLVSFGFYLYAIIADAFLLIIQYGVMERNRLSQQVDAMRELIHQQHRQYQASKESAQLVSEKYHDLKQLLESFRGHVPPEQTERLEERISAYEDLVQTGSDVLDVLLCEKRALCRQKGILLTCYADGSGLDFVEELDLYSLLGNALNNAMEAAEKLPEGERFVTLTVCREEGMTTIHVENPRAEPVVLEDGLPKSQRDPRYHGFGMKSMERVVRKYGGALSVACPERMFCLDILLFAPASCQV